MNQSQEEISMERYLQSRSQSPQKAGILKLSQLKDAVKRKRSSLRRRSHHSSSPKIYQKQEQKKKPKDQIIKNIKELKKKSNTLKEKKESVKVEQEKKQEARPIEVLLETVDRLVNQEKNRIKEIDKLKQANEEKIKNQERIPIINDRSSRILQKKLHTLHEDKEYSTLIMHRDKQIQVDNLPGLSKLHDASIQNQNFLVKMKQQYEYLNSEEYKRLQKKRTEEFNKIIKDDSKKQQKEKEEKQYVHIEYVLDIEKNEEDEENHKGVQTQQIKFKIEDTIKKSQQQIQNVQQIQQQNTPNKKKSQREKRVEIMDQKQGVRAKTELDNYIPIQDRQKLIQQKKEDWINEQRRLKQEQEEEKEKQIQEMMSKSQIIGSVDPEEFYKAKLIWVKDREEKINQLKEKQKKTEDEKNIFKPKISQKSQRIVNNEKVEERLLNYQSKKLENLQRLEQEYLPTFQPNQHLRQHTLFLSSQMSTKSVNNASFNWS